MTQNQKIHAACKFLRAFNGAHDDWADEIERLQGTIKKASALLLKYDESPVGEGDAALNGLETLLNSAVEPSEKP